ncbi:hypothetical protein SH668x_000459 [Planctomicrobium sp. SH668]|uniref:hypothetical protein n=1 Tax=Planctomicrobium sp. SH668 TaxID=3448126 RepID=UPI003F5B06BD
MEIRSPLLLKLKGALFLLLAISSAGLLILQAWPLVDLRFLVLYGISIWGFCRTYYFLFYVLEHYVDPSLKYAGLWGLLRHLSLFTRRSPP